MMDKKISKRKKKKMNGRLKHATVTCITRIGQRPLNYVETISINGMTFLPASSSNFRPSLIAPSAYERDFVEILEKKMQGSR